MYNCISTNDYMCGNILLLSYCCAITRGVELVTYISIVSTWYTAVHHDMMTIPWGDKLKQQDIEYIVYDTI